MKMYRVPNTDLVVSRLAYGCMQIGGQWNSAPLTADARRAAARLVETAVELGINLFDHADIYTRGKSEAAFGEVLQNMSGLRERIVLQSKCGIRFADDPEPGLPGRYDFSYTHIMRAVEGSLKRLQTERLDILLLHRPDPLAQPEEVARAFDELHRAGKVRYFGLSNHTVMQIELLRRYVSQPLVINQLELNALHAHLINDGVMANQAGVAYAAAGELLDYGRLHHLLLQAWSPVAGGQLINPPPGAEARARQAAGAVAQLAERKGTSREAIALAWLLRHPAGIQPVIGTTNVDRLRASCQADEVELSREEWYAVFVAARGAPMP